MTRVLIIDTGSAAADELRAALSGASCEVTPVPWSAGCAGAVAGAMPDLVVVVLPGAQPTAPALIRQLAADSALGGVPVLALGQHSDEPLLVECVAAGAADSLALPLHRELLCARVRAHLRARVERCRHAAITRELASTVRALRASDRVLQEAQRERLYLSTHDPLTGLPNRERLRDLVQQGLDRARQQRQAAAVIALDLDRFRGINAHLGHGVGDQLLQRVSQQLGQCVRPGDQVARVAGDRFGVFLASPAPRDEVARIASQLHARIARPQQLGAHELYVTPSMGIALFPDDGDSPEVLLGHAELALRRAKAEGRGHQRFYSRELSADSLEYMRLEHQLRAALDQGQLCLHYQPQIDAAKGQLIGVEGLVRWIHPERGMVAPRDFIPLAEEAGLIGRLGEWVLREACRQKRTWERAGLGEFPVAVNVSFKQLRSGDLADVVASALAESRLDPRHLELEITENLIMDDLAGALSCLRRIERMGVRIAIDDFGTGYSSLGVLDKLPAHTLKIDQAFVRGIARDPARAAITRTMVAIAQELGMQTLAEGVETEEEMNLLGELGVTRMQGYLFDHPLPAEQFEETWGQDPESDVRLRDG